MVVIYSYLIMSNLSILDDNMLENLSLMEKAIENKQTVETLSSHLEALAIYKNLLFQHINVVLQRYDEALIHQTPLIKSPESTPKEVEKIKHAEEKSSESSGIKSLRYLSQPQDFYIILYGSGYEARELVTDIELISTLKEKINEIIQQEKERYQNNEDDEGDEDDKEDGDEDNKGDEDDKEDGDGEGNKDDKGDGDEDNKENVDESIEPLVKCWMELGNILPETDIDCRCYSLYHYELKDNKCELKYESVHDITYR